MCLISIPEPLFQKGCVITMCHSSFAKVLSEWCRVHQFAFVIADGKWAKRTEDMNIPGHGFRALRKAVQSLKSGKRVIVISDSGCRKRSNEIDFLTERMKFSSLPYRLAKYAEVNLHCVIPEFNNGRVSLSVSEEIHVDNKFEFKTIVNYFQSAFQSKPYLWQR